VEPYGSAPRKNSIEPSPRKEMASPQTKNGLLSPNVVFSRSMSSGAESTDDGFLDSIVNDKSVSIIPKILCCFHCLIDSY